jgi:hypothetical protein
VGTAAELTNDNGQYTICGLPVGTYEVTFYYSDLTVRRPNVSVTAGTRTPLHARMNTGQAGGEVLTIEEKAPSLMNCIGDHSPDPVERNGGRLPGGCGGGLFRRIELPRPKSAPCAR